MVKSCFCTFSGLITRIDAVINVPKFTWNVRGNVYDLHSNIYDTFSFTRAEI